MNSNKTGNVQFATFNERLKPGLMDYFGPFILFFVGSLIQTPLFWVGVFSIIMGALCQLLGLFALFFINGYVPALNKGQTPNKYRAGIKLMKIVNKETMELRELTDNDILIMCVRAFVGWFELFIPFPLLLPYIFISSNDLNQRLADMIAGTVSVVVEPVEEFTMKDFRYKTSQPYSEKFGEPSEKAIKGATEADKATAKTQRVAEGDFTNTEKTLLKISNIIILISSIILIISFAMLMIFQIYLSIHFPINFLGGSSPTQFWLYRFRNAGYIISYISSFILLGGLVLLIIPKLSENKTNLVLSAAFFFLFALFWLIAREINTTDFQVFADINLFTPYTFVVSITRFVLTTLAYIFLIISIFSLNSAIKEINEHRGLEVKTLNAQIFLIVAVSFDLLVNIIGMAAQATDIFGVVMFFLGKLSLLLIYGAIISFSVGVLKLRKLTPN